MEITHKGFNTIMKEKKIKESERKCEECKLKTRKYETNKKIWVRI